MKVVGYKVPGPIAEDAALVDIDLPRPTGAGFDILLEVKAISVNPADYKISNSTPPADGDWKVLGWDAAGIVREVGPDVTQFASGDEVYYAFDGHDVTFLAGYGTIEYLGGPPVEETVSLRFPTMQAARNWYHSPAYQTIAAHHFVGSRYRAFIIEGGDDTPPEERRC